MTFLCIFGGFFHPFILTQPEISFHPWPPTSRKVARPEPRNMAPHSFEVQGLNTQILVETLWKFGGWNPKLTENYTPKN